MNEPNPFVFILWAFFVNNFRDEIIQWRARAWGSCDDPGPPDCFSNVS